MLKLQKRKQKVIKKVLLIIYHLEYDDDKMKNILNQLPDIEYVISYCINVYIFINIFR